MGSRLTTLLAIATIVVGTVELCTRAMAPATRDELVGRGLKTYRGLADELPAAGTIAFLETSDNPVLNAGNYFVAQYALAPRVLVNRIDSSTRFVVSGVEADRGIRADDERLRGFEVAAVGEWGVRVFRRSGP